MLGAILMARPFRPVQVDLEQDGRAEEHESELVTLLTAILPLLVPPMLVLVDVWTGRGVQPGQLAVGMTILAVLAFARTARLLRSEREARRSLAAARDAALAGLPREVGVPGHDEPRDPHADERRHRDDRPAARHRPRPPSSSSTPRACAAPARHC